MSTPGFRATAALGQPTRRYRAVTGSGGGATARAALRPQQFGDEVLSPFEDQSTSYSCESTTNKCTCKGVADCMTMKGSGDCHGAQVYDDVGGYCRWH